MKTIKTKEINAAIAADFYWWKGNSFLPQVIQVELNPNGNIEVEFSFHSNIGENWSSFRATLGKFFQHYTVSHDGHSLVIFDKTINIERYDGSIVTPIRGKG